MKLPTLLAAALAAVALAGPWPAPKRVRAKHFATARVCSTCHANAGDARAMRDAKGRGIAPYDLWRHTMMANAARDPLWRAYVSMEVAATPARKAGIEAKCLRCHAPAAAAENEWRNSKPLTSGVLADTGDLGHLARDGVTCSACHQIRDVALGEKASWSGHFTAGGRQEMYGPHRNPRPRPMQRHTGYTPRHATHILRSAHCATCHTLFGDGGIPEQTPFLEWRNSAYFGEQTCQDCHMRKTDADGKTIRTGIARRPPGGDFPWVRPRAPYGRHVFAGSNTLVPAILGLPPVRRQVESTRLTIVDASRERLTVHVRNLTGHKFPTGMPIRRAWLRVRVRDAAGRVLLAWGDHDEAGNIVDAKGDVLPHERVGGPVAPHRARVTASNEVPIYEASMVDADGKPTHSLVRAVRFGKDNRLLPRGWRRAHADAAATAPIGVDDADFGAGGDTVVFALPAVKGAATVEVDLLYQTLSARTAAELFRFPTPEVESFRHAYERADRAPVAVAKARAKLR